MNCILNNYLQNKKIIAKKNVVFTGTDYVTYSTVQTFYFEPKLSNGSESDMITAINIPAIVTKTKTAPYIHIQ